MSKNKIAQESKYFIPWKVWWRICIMAPNFKTASFPHTPIRAGQFGHFWVDFSEVLRCRICFYTSQIFGVCFRFAGELART